MAAKEQTEKSKYPSRYSNGVYVSPSQYITELICEKKARQSGKDLPIKFWVLPEWEKFYKQQIFSAVNLLKKYSASAIIRALNHNKSKYIYSLRAPHLLPIIVEEERQINIKQSIQTDFKDIERPNVNIVPREPKKQGGGILGKLDNV